MIEKSEAQLRQEEEVRRIKEERGWDTKEYQKVLEKASTSSKIPKIIGIVLIVIVGVVAVLMKDDVANFVESIFRSNEPEKIEQKDLQKQLSSFNECLKDIKASETNELGSYEDLILKYEKTISCYNSYSDVSNQSEKATLEQELETVKMTALQDNSESERQQMVSESNMKYQEVIAKIDIEYQEKLAKIEAESRARKERIEAEAAKYDAETKSWLDDYDKKYAEQSAQYERERAEREAREETLKRQEEAKKEKCDNYKAQYGDKTADELASAENDVVIAKSMWNSALKKVRDCSPANSNRVLTQSQRDACNNLRNQELQTANYYESNYYSSFQQKKRYYEDLKIKACGY